jgi:CubicO group peptidase (beta-lactamase class C family)
MFLLGWLLLISLGTSRGMGQPLPFARPEEVGMSSERLQRVDVVIQKAIEDEDIPGAVLLVARKGRIVYRKAYGYAQLVPYKVKMKADMIFDLASITKPVATAAAVMLLVEEGKIRLLDKVKKFVPQFLRYRDKNGREAPDARIYHLLTHTSGLPPYTDAEKVRERFGFPCPIDSLVQYIALLPKTNPPGEKFHYSCLGFITLAKIVKDLTGKNIHHFTQERIFRPLQMEHTAYIPLGKDGKPSDESDFYKKYRDRIVPTEVVDGKPLHGVVHDPLARTIGGISGNAGLFSCADDLLIFAQMILNGGEFRGIRVFSPLAVKRMTTVYEKVKESGRGLGWDLASAYSSNGGDLFPSGGFGHTGYTGTSIWINPRTQTVVILLANRVHPKDDGTVVPLRSYVANVVASSILEP